MSVNVFGFCRFNVKANLGELTGIKSWEFARKIQQSEELNRLDESIKLFFAAPYHQADEAKQQLAQARKALRVFAESIAPEDCTFAWLGGIDLTMSRDSFKHHELVFTAKPSNQELENWYKAKQSTEDEAEYQAIENIGGGISSW